MSKNTKKPILAENTVRRFMKLASIDTLSDGFVNETYKMEEEEMNEMGGYEDKMEEQEDEMGAAEEEAEIEMPDEAPTDEAAEEVTISDDEAEALIDAHNAADEVVAKLEDAMAGEEPEAEEAEEEAAEEGEEEEAEEEEMPPMDADLMEGEEVMEELYEAALSGLNIDIEQKSKEELVNEVKKAIFQRVVRRLIKESKSK
jgi:hypothetical protein